MDSYLINQYYVIFSAYLNWKQSNEFQLSFLRKIQNRTNRKTVKKTVLLYAIWILNLEVVVFPSKFKILNLGVVIHYLENKVGVVDFANAQGVVMF